ncbi:hypothetical protein KSF_054310 [Reticulibacter mediterranei]|uniref:Uncharacterized protein n=1 Tax=Reticulibacter mediterranei TaxID=2778369 RepID=A0A8J3IN11_9CHLR|nr:hypothetical protein KSF_054310 [Reticulibacter mediterranei]
MAAPYWYLAAVYDVGRHVEPLHRHSFLGVEVKSYRTMEASQIHMTIIEMLSVEQVALADQLMENNTNKAHSSIAALKKWG